MLLPEKIERLLGIPAEQIRQAIRVGELPRRGADAVAGITLLRWLEEKAVPYRVTEQAAAEYRREHAASAPPERPRGLVDAAAEKLDQWRGEDRDGAEAEYEDYLRILLRAETPADDDASRLADLILALQLSPEQVAEDQRTIKKALRLEALHEEREEASKKALDAGRSYHDWVIAKNREEERGGVEAESLANRSQQCALAAGELLALSRQRPELFAAGDAPRVKRPEST